MKKQSIPYIFLNNEALQYFLNTEIDPKNICPMDMIFEPTEFPFYVAVTAGKKAVMTINRRIGMHDPTDEGREAASMTFDVKTGKNKVKAEKSVSELVGPFFKVCIALANFIRDNNLLAACEELDIKHEGILIRVKNGEAKAEIVSGHKRPMLAYEALFGGVENGRPYSDEFVERSMMEMMSFEDKVALAEAGDENALDEMMRTYINGNEGEGIEPDPEKACYWMRRAGEEGFSVGAFNLGLHYAKGFGVPRDFEEAAKWMEKAAELGDEDAEILVERYRRMSENLRKAEAGDAQAQADVASEYMILGGSLNEAGPGEDYKESVKWAKKAAVQNNGDGIWTLALAYEHGRGVKQDVEKAIALYRKGVEAGHARSMHSLGCYYARGDHMEQDWRKSFELFMKAAELGDGMAMEAVGHAYQFAQGTPGNMKKAVEWYEKAAAVQNNQALAQKAADFRRMGETDSGWDQDYPEEFPGDVDDEAVAASEEAFAMFITRMIDEGRLTSESDFAAVMQCLQEEAEKGDEIAQALLG